MARITPLTGDQVAANHPELIATIRGVYGNEPSSFGVLDLVPGLLEAAAGLSLVAMRAGQVDIGLKWMVANVASRSAGCMYCSAHTGFHAHETAGVDAQKVEAVWEFETDPRFDDRERAALRLALAAAQVPNAATDETFVELHRYFDDVEIAEIVAVIALFGFFNRWNDTLATDLEDAPTAFGAAHLAQTGWRPPRRTTPVGGPTD